MHAHLVTSLSPNTIVSCNSDSRARCSPTVMYEFAAVSLQKSYFNFLKFLPECYRRNEKVSLLLMFSIITMNYNKYYILNFEFYCNYVPNYNLKFSINYRGL